MDNKCKILLVDDVDMNLVILSEIINSMGHEPLCALSAKAALEILRNDLPHLILLDVSMPDMSGLEFCEILKNDVYTREIPVIFISAMDSQEDFSKAFELGAVDYIFKPFDANNVKMRVSTHLKVYRMQQELEDANKKLNTVLKHQIDSSRQKMKALFTGISQIIEMRYPGNTHNCGKESQMIRVLAQAMQFSDKFEDAISETMLFNLEMAALFHDIGMLSIPESILLKSEALTAKEREMMEEHVYAAERYIECDKIQEIDRNDEFVDVLKTVIKYHHERYDGTGYPEGLKGEDIPLEARIMAVIDVYDALMNNRSFRGAFSPEEAMEIMENGAGTQFDPDIVAVLKKIQRQFNKFSVEVK